MRRHGYHSASRDDYNLFEALGDFVGDALMNADSNGKALVDAETLWRLGWEIAKQVDRIRKNDYPKIEWTYNGGD